MTIPGLFTLQNNRLQVAEQEYNLAKEHQAEVLKHRDPTNHEHAKRLNDAQERLEVAREAWFRVVGEYE